LKVLAPSAVPLLPEGPLKRSIWVFIIAPWYKPRFLLERLKALLGKFIAAKWTAIMPFLALGAAA
jgi:hypothetical protein